MNITTRSYEPELFRQLGVDMENCLRCTAAVTLSGA